MKQQNGFSAVEGLLIIVIVAILGFTGWYVWHSKQSTDKTNSQAATDSQPVNSSSNSTSSSDSQKTYTAKVGKFTLQYPSSWELTDSNSNNDPAVAPQESMDLTSSDGAKLGYNYTIHNFSGPSKPSDFGSCGQGSRCDSDHVYALKSFDSGAKFGKVYTVLDTGRGLKNYQVFLFKPVNANDLPKIGVNSFTDKMYFFAMYDSKGNAYYISATMPDSFNNKTAQQVENSTDYKDILQILQSFRSS